MTKLVAHLLSLLISSLLTPEAAPAQQQARAEPPFARAMVARLDRLAADSAVRAKTGAANDLALFGVARPDALGRIDDAALVRLLGLVEEGLGTVDAPTCALAYGRSGVDGLPQAFVAIATRLDSAQADRWADALLPLFVASVQDRPLGPRAPADEARAAIVGAFDRLPPDVRSRVDRAAVGTGSADDTCLFVRTTFASLLHLPGGRAAPVLRTLMFGPDT